LKITLPKREQRARQRKRQREDGVFKLDHLQREQQFADKLWHYHLV
jgi:hypothetical protein